MKNIIQQLKNEGIACLFSILLVYWMMGILCDKYKLIGLFLVAMIHIVLFAFFLYCKWQKEVGNKGVEILFVFVFIVYISIAIFIIKTTSLAKGSSYGLWFIYGSNTGNIDIGYWVGSILLVSFLFGGTVFYFTNIRFRIWVILLLSMIVFIMETTKGSLGITFDFIIFCFLFFILYTEYENKMKGNSILFVFITLGITLIIPKPDVLPQIPVMDAIIYGTVKTLGGNVQILTGGNGINRLNGSILTTKRFINGGLVPDGKEVLFEVEGKEPLYLRMQSFDQYEKNYWYTGEGSLDNGGILKKEYYKRNAQKFNTIISILDKLKDEGWMEENFSNIYKYLEYPSYPQRVNRAQVILKNHYTKSFFNPLGVFGIKEMGRERNIYISQSTICFLGMGESIDLNSKYYIDYISQGITPNSREFGVMTQMNKKTFKDISMMLSKKINSLTEYEQDTLSIAALEMKDAYDYYTKLDKNTSLGVYELAQEITDGKDTDYDKALAIQNFFHNSSFIYTKQLPRVPRDIDYNEYFIFESKKGICVQFASAMVILARASGLPARYVEGYVVNEKDLNTDRYLVRSEHAHAFPEVYIAGYGWMTFEPTAGIIEENKEGVGLFKKLLEDYFSVLVYIAGILVFALIILIALKYLREVYWKRKIKRINKSQAVHDILQRTAKNLDKIKLGKKDYETMMEFLTRIHEITKIPMMDLGKVFDHAIYGETEPKKEDIEKAMAVYEKIKVFIKKYK